MDLKQLKAFLTVAETGNVTRAAEVLHLVQPAVSRQIRLLEEDVGAPLFQRERHGMVLTEAGHALSAYARRALLELERARAEIDASARAAQAVGGLVTLGLLPSTIDLLASPLVSALAAQYPGIRVRLAMGYGGTLQRWLTSGEVDAALLYGPTGSPATHPGTHPDVQAEPLVDEPLWAIAPAAAGLSPQAPVSLQTLAAQPLVLPNAPHGIRAVVDHACAVRQLSLQVAVETNALSVQRALVLGGHGWTVLPPIAVAEELRQGALSGAPLTDPDLRRTLVLALPTERPTARHVRCATQVLAGCVQQALADGRWAQGVWVG
ncbi:LysR family transcriptional regulator [Ideonella livida]|uniref:LysR family transcriptional regulator n=1 Tax=Ideonella livida TaxID=2707176 RepID=A0A7C9PIF8_9BURK|nr:LysR family transcriptional regulator [Ideonella livida]NDY92031.1 LysR family transcriptional regulator [Ideonella livida]